MPQAAQQNPNSSITLPELEKLLVKSSDALLKFPPHKEQAIILKGSRLCYELDTMMARVVADRLPCDNVAYFLNSFKIAFPALQDIFRDRYIVEGSLSSADFKPKIYDLNFEIKGECKERLLDQLNLPEFTKITLLFQKDKHGKCHLNLLFQKPPADHLTDTLAYVLVEDSYKPNEASIHVSPEGQRWQKFLAPQNAQSRLELLRLEQLAQKTNQGKQPLGSDESSPLEIYKLGMSGFDHVQFFEGLRRELNLPYIFVADLGGGAGTAAKELELSSRVKSFVIDRYFHKPKEEQKGVLPNRYIVSSMEKTPLPDNSMHGIMTFNAFHYSDVFKSFEESYRILKPGGKAAIEYELWSTEHRDLRQLPDYIKKNLRIVFYTRDRLNESFSSQPAMDVDSFARYRQSNIIDTPSIKSGQTLSHLGDERKMLPFREIMTARNTSARFISTPVFILSKPIENKGE